MNDDTKKTEETSEKPVEEAYKTEEVKTEATE